MEVESLDTGWINDFEEEDKDYSMFYKETVNDALACFIYIDNTNTIF